MAEFLIPITVNTLPSIAELNGKQGMFILPDGSININRKNGTWFTINKQSDHAGIINPDTVVNPLPGSARWYWAGPGTYPNAGGLIISKYGIISYTGSVWQSLEVQLPSATQYIAPFEGSTFPITGPAQRTYENSIWELSTGSSADSNEVPGQSDKWTAIAASSKDEVVYKVLDSFVSGNGTTVDIDTTASLWEAKAYVIGQGYVSNSYNMSVKFDVSDYDKLNITCKKFLTADPNDLNVFATVIGVNAAGIASKLVAGMLTGNGITEPNQVPTETFNGIDITAFKDLYIIRSNSLTSRPQLRLIQNSGASLDSVKNYIDGKLSGGRIFNVQSYGAKGDGINIDRISIQNAINACFAAGGGKIYFPYPSAFYNLGTELTAYNQVYGQTSAAGIPKAQLIIPLNTDTTKLIVIELVGEFKINMADEAITSVGRSTKGFIKSGYIESATGEYTSILASVYANANTWGNKNYIHVHMENLVFRTETMSGNSHIENKMHGINMYNVTQFTFDYLKVETSSPLANTVEPTYSIGIIMPSVNNKVQIGEGRCYVVGYNSGIMLGEHYTSGRTIVLGCVNALQFPDSGNSYHSASIMHFNAECCRNMILMSGSNQVLNIFNYDVEHHNDGAKWYNFQNDIKKTGGTGSVNIFNAQVTKSNVGNVNEFNVAGNPDYKVMSGVGHTDNKVYLTMAQYNALSTAEKNNGKEYFIES